jgi:S1-C subfamily serine protease
MTVVRCLVWCCALAVAPVAGVTACAGESPDSAIVDETEADADAAAQAAVRVVAEGCSVRPTLGSGSFVLDHHVLTVAHVVAGADHLTVTTRDGIVHEATIVAIDRQSDLAVLAVPTADVEPLPIRPMQVGDEGALIVTRRDVPVVESFAALRFVDIDASNIDGTSSSLRLGFQIDAQIEHGDSGAVLVVHGGAAAVVFARSRAAERRAWATDIRQAATLLAGITAPPDPAPPLVDADRCAGAT